MQFSEINALGETLSFSSVLQKAGRAGALEKAFIVNRSVLPESSSEASAFFVFGGQSRPVAWLLHARLQLPLCLWIKHSEDAPPPDRVQTSRPEATVTVDAAHNLSGPKAHHARTSVF